MGIAHIQTDAVDRSRTAVGSPVGVNRGVCVEHGVGGDLCAAPSRRIPAVKGVVFTARCGQRGHLAVLVSGQRCCSTYTAVGVQGNRVDAPNLQIGTSIRNLYLFARSVGK